LKEGIKVKKIGMKKDDKQRQALKEKDLYEKVDSQRDKTM